MSKFENEVIAPINKILQNEQNENDVSVGESVGGIVKNHVGELEGAFANTLEHFIIATCCLGIIAIAFFTVIGIAKKKVSFIIHSIIRMRRWRDLIGPFVLPTQIIHQKCTGSIISSNGRVSNSGIFCVGFDVLLHSAEIKT